MGHQGGQKDYIRDDIVLISERLLSEKEDSHTVSEAIEWADQNEI
jgi:hypothetical protein